MVDGSRTCGRLEDLWAARAVWHGAVDEAGNHRAGSSIVVA